MWRLSGLLTYSAVNPSRLGAWPPSRGWAFRQEINIQSLCHVKNQSLKKHNFSLKYLIKCGVLFTNHTLVKHEWKGSELEIMPTVPLKISFIISSSSRIFDESIRIFIKYWPPWNLGGCDRISNKILRAYILGYGTKPNLAQPSFRGRNFTGRGPTICRPPSRKYLKCPLLFVQPLPLKLVLHTSHNSSYLSVIE